MDSYIKVDRKADKGHDFAVLYAVDRTEQTWRIIFAAVTYWLPGPKIFSTWKDSSEVDL